MLDITILSLSLQVSIIVWNSCGTVSLMVLGQFSDICGP